MGRWLAIIVVCVGCRADWDDWEIYRVADGTPVYEDEVVMLVVDQPLSLALTLQSHESHYYYAPDNVRFVIDHETWLEVTVVGEVELPMMRDSTQIDLRATQVGNNRVRIISDSTDEPLPISIIGVAP